jgi:hypothetical protein
MREPVRERERERENERERGGWEKIFLSGASTYKNIDPIVYQSPYLWPHITLIN